MRFIPTYVSSRNLAAFLIFTTLVSAQTTAPPHRSIPSKRYCHANVGFCFRYPGSWSVLGDVFNGNGVVIAPQQKGERAQWDAITVALVAPAGENGDGPSLNKVIEMTTADMREAGQSFQTLQRKDLTVAHDPAQMLKAQYRDNTTGRDWVEELIFIQGQENEIYSVSLKCAPQNLMRLEPALKELLASWSTPEATSPAAAVPSDAAPPASGPPADSTPPKP
jgi:hypothetical protein